MKRSTFDLTGPKQVWNNTGWKVAFCFPLICIKNVTLQQVRRENGIIRVNVNRVVWPLLYLRQCLKQPAEIIIWENAVKVKASVSSWDHVQVAKAIFWKCTRDQEVLSICSGQVNFLQGKKLFKLTCIPNGQGELACSKICSSTRTSKQWPQLSKTWASN